MDLNDAKPGMDHAYFCRKNKVICNIVNCDFEDAAALIIATVLPDGDIMGPLLYTEACYLTPMLELAGACTTKQLKDTNATVLETLTGACCKALNTSAPQPPRVPADHWSATHFDIIICSDPYDIRSRNVRLNAADLAAMTEALNNEN